ncbi:MAG TPA: hypothetical protein VF656_19025 [Pyrinomonadaceae bacterium]|jgi:hypothetical protein
MNSLLNNPDGGETSGRQPDSPPPAGTPVLGAPSSPKRRGCLIPLLLLVLIPLAIYGWNYVTLQRKMNDVLKQDPRNKGVDVSTHYKTYVNPNVLVYDLRGIEGTNSKLDVMRVLLQFAEKVKDEKFDKLELAFRGETKFLLDGDYFQSLGREYNFQNPIYTMNHLSENVKRPDGTDAFSTWTGGWLGVTTRQTQDFNDFHDQWYWRSVISK